MPRIDIMGCKFDSWDTQKTVSYIENMIRKDERGYLCTVNVSILMMMRGNSRLTDIVHKAKMVVADGQPIIWASKYLKKTLPERVTGIELIEHIAKLAEKHDWGIYLLGATKPVVKDVRNNLLETHPKLVISGYEDGYFDDTKAHRQAEKIEASGAVILIAAMGVPRQEYFIKEHWEYLGVNFAIGVGGSFDVIAGVSRRAPLWMQNSGLEWLFRLIQEPKRLFGRYLKTNSQFIYLFIKEIVLGHRK